MARERHNTLRIRTPEGIVFSQTLAGPVARSLAWAVDAFMISALVYVISIVAGLLAWISGDFVQAAMMIGFFVAQFGYFILLESLWQGQTVGKRLCRLRVVDMHGLRLQFGQIVIRNLLRVVDALPLFYLTGGLAMWLNRHGQRLGDLAANTVVVRHPLPRPPNLDQLLAGKFNSLRAYSHLTARLHQRISPGEAMVALQALVRRDELEPAARVELFAELADHFRAVVEFPPEAVEGISDENHVRNVVDVLFRPRGEPSGAAAVRR